VAVGANYTYSETESANLRFVYVTNGSGATVFLGGSGVTTATGVALAASTTFPTPFILRPTEGLYGIVSSTGTTVSVLSTGA
jgi:hypothetical protein